MQSHWLNKQDHNKLIIFFTGWSFDYKPFEFLNCEDFDVLIIYDYNDLELPQIPEYIPLLPRTAAETKKPQPGFPTIWNEPG